MNDKYDNKFEHSWMLKLFNFKLDYIFFLFPKVRAGNLQLIASHIFTFVFLCDIQKASAYAELNTKEIYITLFCYYKVQRFVTDFCGYPTKD